MKTAFGYVRVSTEDQADNGVSLDAQKAKIQAYCKLHGIELQRIHADEGASGKDMDRNGLVFAVSAAADTNSVLVVTKLDRLTRSVKDAITIVEKLRVCNAHLVSIEENIDTTTAMGEFIFHLFASLAQMERKMIGERTKAALAHKKANGEVYGTVPFGYRNDNGQIVRDSREQAVLSQIWHLRGCGYSFRSIAEDLAQRRMPPRAGGEWNPGTIKRLCDRMEGENAAGVSESE